jgi:translocation and assembly module TamB
MRSAARALRWFGTTLGLLIAICLAAFGLLQTQAGRTWFARTVAQAISDPDFTVAIEGLGGIVPFRVTVETIEIGDRDGVYLTLRDVGLDVSAVALLSRRLHIRSLSFGEIDMARSSTAPSTTPVTEYFEVPHLPIEVALDRLSIGRLALAPPVLGESVVATVEGNAQLAGETAHVALDLHRTDGAAGKIGLALELSGSTPVLSLRLDAAEPTGVLLDRSLGRTDRLPLALSVNGSGPLADWHGRLSASAGAVARLDADVNLAVTTKTVFGLSGTTELTALLPPEFAPLVGDRVALSLHAAFGDRIVVDALSIGAAVGTVTGEGAFGGPNEAVEAHLRANAPELSPLAGLFRDRLEGAASLTADITGTQKRPALALNLSGTAIRLGSLGAEHIEAEVSATPTGVLDKPDSRVEFAAKGRIEGLVPPEGVAVPRELGRDIDWSLAGIAARDGSTVDLTHLSAEGAGLTLNGSGQLTGGDQTIEGQLSLSIADLRPFSGLAGHPLAGALDLAANAVRQGSAGFKATLHGSTKELRTGIAAGDALLGDAATLTGSLQRDAAGTLSVDQLAISGAAVNLSGEGRFDPASNRLVAALALELPRLKPLGAALGTEMSGALSARINAEGPLDRLRLKSEAEGNDFAAAGTKIDRLRLTAEVADLSDPKAALDGTYRAYGLDGTLALTAEPKGNSQLVLPRFRLTAADSAIDGSLRIALDTGLIQGSINGRAPDLGRFSRVAGTPLGGNLVFSAGLDARRSQLLDLSLNGDRLTAGTGSSRIGIGRIVLMARFADVLSAPSGTGRLALTSASFGKAEFATANFALDTPRPGRLAFQGEAKGQPLTVSLGGDGTLEPGRAELRLIRLNGSLGSDRILLRQPLTLSRRGSDLSFSGLALDFGTGRITGNGGVRADSLSLALNAGNLPVASGARLLGYPKARGTLTVATTLDGTLRAPRGHISLNARELSFFASKHSRAPTLGLDVNGNWNGRSIDLQGQVTGLKGDSISLAGSAPLLLTPSPLGISVPANGPLRFQLRGAGRLENLADLLPLGEDRVSGRFATDIAVSGTVAAPSASGRLKLSEGRYENFATGAVLTNLQAEAVGDRDRLTLTSFSAGDSASGSLKAQGNVVLTGPSGPTAALSATLANFRVAARDELVATATGTASITGPLTAPKVTAPFTIDRADINLPDSLPPNVVVIKVTRVNSNAGKQPTATPVAEPPALPATLDIKIDMPGNIFVRGHGLESEWRGELAITGTSAAPAINGSLEQIRGSVDLLGKTFTLTRGRIIFDGSDKLDPVLDIVAEASTADITAQVNIGGLASAPTITLTSTPVVPQDEILSRVLFGKSVGQITPGEGIQLAAAAATLAGGGPGVLDRLRGGLGLDWFKLGSSSSGPTTGSLNPGGANSSAASGTALSAGKYIVPGVSVGVSQGISPPTSKITVEVQVRPHLTVGGEVGQGGGTGLGINYNYDY